MDTFSVSPPLLEFRYAFLLARLYGPISFLDCSSGPVSEAFFSC
jgi:hypothetical protein